MKSLLLMLSTALVPTMVAAQVAVDPSQFASDTVTVVGTGRVVLAPDRVSFTAGVTTQAATVEQAVTQNNTNMARVIAALRQAGATDPDIRTSGFNVFPQYDHTDGRRSPVIVGFQASNNVTVTRQDPAEAGRMLTIALQAGANTVSGLQFSISDRAAAEGDGLQRALENARVKALRLATAAGRTLGRTISVIESGAQQIPPPMPQRMMAMEARIAPDVPIEAGTDELVFSVTAVFEMR